MRVIEFRCRECGWAGAGADEGRVKLVVAAHVLLCHPEIWAEDAVAGEDAEVMGKLGWSDLECAIARR